jgi:hypothetical protein
MPAPQRSPAGAGLARRGAGDYISITRRCCAKRIRSKAIMLTRFLRRRRTRHAWTRALDFTHPRVTAALALFHRHV